MPRGPVSEWGGGFAFFHQRRRGFFGALSTASCEVAEVVSGRGKEMEDLGHTRSCTGELSSSSLTTGGFW